MLKGGKNVIVQVTTNCLQWGHYKSLTLSRKKMSLGEISKNQTDKIFLFFKCKNMGFF